LIDNYKTKGLRKRLVQKLKSEGISDTSVLSAIEKIPRHFFLDTAFTEHAYKNKAFPIGFGQTISHPYTVAYQTQMLEIKKGDKVLEIGTGSGYQTCVLAELGAQIYTVERIAGLSKKAEKICKKLGYTANFFIADGTKTVVNQIIFDKIIITAGAPVLPVPLMSQLKTSGKLIIPIGNQDSQEMMLYTKTDQDKYTVNSLGTFSFVPLLGENGWRE